MFARMIPLCAVSALSIASVPAMAELPLPVRAMIDAAIEGGDNAKVLTVLDLARATNPDAAGEIDQIRAEWQARQAEAAEVKRREREEAIRDAGPLALWSGEGQLGASHASGNTDSVGLSAALELQRKGLEWTHILRGRADYQRTNGATNREQYFAAYEPRIQASPRLFGYGLAQYERNRFQGFDHRYALSGGLGYKVVATPSVNLSLKAGPAYRVTEFTSGTQESRLGALAAVDFDWQLADGLKLTQGANVVAETGAAATVILDGANTTVNLVTGLDARLTGRLRSRLSYAVDYDSNPPAGSVSTDTISRLITSAPSWARCMVP
ncbi:DUF481 domain-containing protein [Leptolyngbya sp. 15MV]|nr:DUF481 domain-containing protein [Leptolyngbya sp. 15MV]